MFSLLKRMFVLLCSLCFLFITTSTLVFATTNTDIDFNGKLSQGRDVYYWVSPSNEYISSIPSAVSKLRYPSGMYNPIVLNKTSVQKQSKIDIYQYSSRDNTNAYQQSFRKNANGQYYNCTSQMDSYDWVFGKVYINDQYMKNYNNDLKSTIILHEILHNYGCKDIANSSSIMYFATPNVRGLTSDANRVLNNKY